MWVEGERRQPVLLVLVLVLAPPVLVLVPLVPVLEPVPVLVPVSSLVPVPVLVPVAELPGPGSHSPSTWWHRASPQQDSSSRHQRVRSSISMHASMQPP